MYLNCSETIFDGDGKFNIPIIKPMISLPTIEKWDMFETARLQKQQPSVPAYIDYRQDYGVHFFQDDHKFEIVWQKPRKHLEKLKLYGCVLSPDFSMYTDFPIAVQIMQHYKKHWVARFWQEEGLAVIPTICWSTPESYDWCFDGEPHNSIVAVSDIGCCRDSNARDYFQQGFNEMLKRLQPSSVLFFTYRYNQEDTELIKFINIKNQKHFIARRK